MVVVGLAVACQMIYRIPIFKYHGMLVGFAPFKNHYPEEGFRRAAIVALDRPRQRISPAPRPLLTQGTGATEKNIETVITL